MEEAQSSLQGQGGLPGRRDNNSGVKGGPELFFSSVSRERDPRGEPWGIGLWDRALLSSLASRKLRRDPAWLRMARTALL